jgi:CubicO group peptidase (beta-lactamase class C family)
MQATGLHEAQVAIGKGGVILLERAYTWSEPGRHIIQTADKFQLASLSKMFCAAAIQSLIDAGQLSLTTRPWFDFGSRAPWGPLAPGNRYLDITIEHLLNHQGGWDRRISSDWEFRMIEISNTFGLSGPPTLSEFIAYIGFYVRLDFDPGTATEYSNVGYMALSQVVETVTGMTYMEYVKSALLVPLGLGNSVGLFGTDPSLHVNDPVTPQSTFWGPNVQTPQDPTNLIASVFGGDGAYKETALGASNIICSAATLVKFMNRHGEFEHCQ